MKIGIDARFLTHPQLGGFKTYTVNLIEALSQIDKKNQYKIYIDRPPSENIELPQSNNFSYRVVHSNLPLFGMPCREQVLLRRQITKDKPDIIHFLCNTAPLNIPANSILSLLDVIQVKSPQNFSTTSGLENYRRWAITEYSKFTILRTAHKATKIITLSHYEKSEIVKHLNISPERIHVTYFGVNPVFTQADIETKDIWRCEMAEKLSLPIRYILGVGYEPRKNIPLLIRAFSHIAERYLDLNLVIVAAEKERRLYFRQLSSELGYSDRVLILESLTPHELAKLYNLAEVFVFPSIRESFGAPPLEAIACGTPTIAMNMTSLPEVLCNGALMIDGEDVEIWANAIEMGITDQILRKNLIRRGLKQAAKHTWQNCAKNTVQAYESIYNQHD